MRRPAGTLLLSFAGLFRSHARGAIQVLSIRFSFPAIKKADREQRSAGCLFVISTASMKKCGQLYLFGFLEEECIVLGAVFAVPIMHYAGLPPDKNKRFRSFRSNTAFLHPILLSASHIAVSLFRQVQKKWYQL